MWLVLAVLFAQSVDFVADGVKALDAKQYPTPRSSPGPSPRRVAADPKDYSAHFHLALAYSLLGMNAEAVPEYKATPQLKPGLYEAEINLGICLLRTKDAENGSSGTFAGSGGTEAEGVSTGVLSGARAF